tara:strand:- start:187 stop:696 length:510 start_codon:yes stop_codon:yes gene_type:complete
MAALTIYNLPEGKANIIYPQLSQLTKNLDLSMSAYPAIMRLADHSSKDTALDYVKLLKLHSKLSEAELSVYRKQRWQRSLPFVISNGICRLGKNGAQAKEALLNIYEPATSKSKYMNATLRALISIHAEEDVRQIVDNKNYKWVLPLINDLVKERDASPEDDICVKKFY